MNAQWLQFVKTIIGTILVHADCLVIIAQNCRYKVPQAKMINTVQRKCKFYWKVEMPYLLNSFVSCLFMAPIEILKKVMI